MTQPSSLAAMVGPTLFRVDGADVAIRTYRNFVGVTVTDDAEADQTTFTIAGIVASELQLDTENDGPRVANESGALAVRNAADDAYEEVIAATATLTEDAITMRSGASTDGDGLIEVKQTGDSVMFGWVSAEAKFGVSSDGGATYTYLDAAAPPACSYDEFEGSQAVTETTAAITDLSITPTAGNYLLTALPVITPPAETYTVSVAIYIAGTIVSVTNRSHPPTGSAATWEPALQVKSTLTGSQAVTVQVICDGTATVTKCTLTALEVS